MYKRGGRTEKRLKKIAWKFKRPAWARNQGIWLPCCQKGVAHGIARQIYFGEYESKEIDIVSRRLSPDDVVLEVGTGLGYLSAFCAKRIGSEKVHTFEANPALIPMILATYERNGISPSVHNVILARGSGTRTFYVDAEFWASSTMSRGAESKAIEVPQRDLNAEIDRIKPTFMIVDIEGGEADFFAYARLDGVNKICIETHADLIGNSGVTEVFDHIFRQGFSLDFGCIRKNVFYFYRESAH